MKRLKEEEEEEEGGGNLKNVCESENTLKGPQKLRGGQGESGGIASVRQRWSES